MILAVGFSWDDGPRFYVEWHNDKTMLARVVASDDIIEVSDTTQVMGFAPGQRGLDMFNAKSS